MEAEDWVEHREGSCVLRASPSRGLAYNTPKVSLHGAPAGSVVAFTLTLLPEQASDAAFVSAANFIVDENGEVDLSNDAAVSGSYTGVDVSGLWWSLAPGPGARPGERFAKRDACIPCDAVLSAKVGGGQQTLEVTLQRWYLAERVARKVLDGTDSPVGVLFSPPADMRSGSSCGVVLLGGSAGELKEVWGAALASKGFPVLCLRFIGPRPLPKSANELDLAYVVQACSWLKKEIGIPVVLMGSSLGAQVALDAAAAGASICGVVSLAGSSVRSKFGEPGRYLHGAPLPCVPFDGANFRFENGVVEMAPGTHRWLGNDPDVLEARLPCEAIPVPVLLASGSDDRNWASEPMADQVLKQLTRPCHAGSAHICYVDAGHIIEPPLTPLTKVSWHPAGSVVAMGGCHQAHHKAQMDLFPRCMEFLNVCGSASSRL